MGWNFFRSINLGGGIRLNLSKKGIGFSFGIPGLRASTGPSGNRLYASIPGTGIYYRKTLSSKKSMKGNSEINTEVTETNATSTELEFEDKRILLFQLIFGDGLVLLKSNRLTEALHKFAKGLKYNRNSADSYFLRSLILYRLNKPQRATTELSKALDRAEYITKDIRRVKISCKFELQISSKNKVILSFEHSSLIILLAECFADCGEEKRCLGLLTEYLQANPDAEEILYVLMRKYYDSNDFKSVIILHGRFALKQISPKNLICELLYAYSEFYSGNNVFALKYVEDILTRVIGSTHYASVYNVKQNMLSLLEKTSNESESSLLAEPIPSITHASDSVNEQSQLFKLIGYLIASADGQISENEIAGIISNRRFAEIIGTQDVGNLQEEFDHIKSTGLHKSIDEKLRKIEDNSLKIKLISFAFDIAYSDMEFSPKEFQAIKYIASCVNFKEDKLELIHDQAELDFIRYNFEKVAKEKRVWLIESLNKRGLHAKNIGWLLGLSSKEVRQLKSTRPLKRLPEEKQQEILHYIKNR
jgi:tetratricopeptide (TPR) repeat protein